jgi:tetratricopeptide (TPR) repeat protein
LCILSHFLCYYPALEYHYTAVLAVLPVLLWLWQQESVRFLRRLLLASFVVSLLIFAPTPLFLAPRQPARFQNIDLLQRVVPVGVTFVCLTIYGVASTWLGWRRSRLILAQMAPRLLLTLRQGAIPGALLGSVLAAAYWTVPDRCTRMPAQWTGQDFAEHYEDMITQLQRTVAAQPNDGEAHFNLGNALTQRGRLDEACTQYRKVLEVHPNSAFAYYNIGMNLRRLGRLDEAIVQYRKGLAIRSEDALAQRGLAEALAARGQVPEAILHYRRTLKINPHDAASCNNLAWLLATCADASVRNGTEAVARAERAKQVVGDVPDVLNTLAAAYAESGRFPEAVATAQKAVELARHRNNLALADTVQVRMALYEAGKPYHQPPSVSAPRLPKP